MNRLAEKLLTDCDLILVSKESFTRQSNGFCAACGLIGPFESRDIINDKLASEWSLSKRQHDMMSARESMYCVACGCSYRLRRLAEALNFTMNSKHGDLLATLKSGDHKDLSIAEINSNGVLHDILNNHQKLSYSEYGSTDDSVADEDIQKLSYADESFDIVLTSDTLEHVPDTKRAIQETYRVLKPGGSHVFTVPLYLDRKTRHRIELSKGKAKKLMPDSFHGAGQPDYVVWHEFGVDFIDILKEEGFDARYCFVNFARMNDDVSGVIVATKRIKTVKKISSTTIMHDGSNEAIGITNEISEKLGVSKTNVQALSDRNIDTERQIQRVSAIKYKLDLTAQHARNLEGIVSHQNAQIDNLAKRNEVLEVKNLALEKKIYRRIERKLNNLFIKRK